MNKLEIFCNECVNVPEYEGEYAPLFLKNPVHVTSTIQRLLGSSKSAEPSIQDLQASIMVYMKAKTQERSNRKLKLLYKDIAAFLTKLGVPTEYYSDEQHAVQSGAKSIAIMADSLYVFNMRKPFAVLKLRFPSIVAAVLPRLMQN